MPLYHTTYETPTGVEYTQCYARDADHFAEVVKLRGMGETPHIPWPGDPIAAPPVMPSTYLLEQKWIDAMHALIWVGMIATKAGIADGWGLLNDHGILHGMSHVLMNTRHGYGHDVTGPYLERVKKLEREVPGVHPCWGGAEVAPSARLTGNRISSIFTDEFNSLKEDFRRLGRPFEGIVDVKTSIEAMEGFFFADIDAVVDKPIKPGGRGFDLQRLKQMQDARSKKFDLVVQLRKQQNAKARKGMVSVDGKAIGKVNKIWINGEVVEPLTDDDIFKVKLAAKKPDQVIEVPIQISGETPKTIKEGAMRLAYGGFSEIKSLSYQAKLRDFIMNETRTAVLGAYS